MLGSGRTRSLRLLLPLLACIAACAPPDDPDASLVAEPLTFRALNVAPIGVGNALTLPAQRHIVQMGGTLLLALQQDGKGGHALGFYRSDDGGATWGYVAPIQDSTAHRDTADLVAVGGDVALVYSYEGPELVPSVAHDVTFQFWRRAGTTWRADPAVRVFDSIRDDTAYYRAELARDSFGRFWVQAFKLEPAGTSTARIAVSSDGGKTFQPQPLLTALAYRGGGRLLALGDQMVFLYDGHEAGAQPARFRVRDDAQPVATWGPAQVAWSEGIYHGAALSAVADGDGGFHIVYKDKAQRLWYRHFDGATATFGARTAVDDAGDWELQPAITRVGDDVEIFYNHVVTSGAQDEVRFRSLHDGVLGAAQLLEGGPSFRGYPAAPDTLTPGTVTWPCIFGVTPDGSSSGNARAYLVSSGTGALFGDSFDRSIAPDGGLGASWSIGSGLWFANGRAVSDHDGGDRVTETAAQCTDCRVQATVHSYGVPETAIFLRAPSAASADRYEVVLAGNRDVLVRRVRAGVTTVLGRAASGVSSLGVGVTLALSARGSAPVTLTASVNGDDRVTVTDSGSAALTSAGYAGLYTTSAGVGFDDFTLSTPLAP